MLLRTEDPRWRSELAGDLGRSVAEITELVFDSPSGRAAQRGKIPAREHWQQVGQLLGLSQDGLDDFRKRFFAGDRLDHALIAAIRTLKQSYTTAVLSNMSDELRPLLEQDWQIADAFDHIIISAEQGLMKPDPRIYRIALDRCGIVPAQAVFIDDFQENVRAARDLGLQAIWFRDPPQALADLYDLIGMTELDSGGEAGPSDS